MPAITERSTKTPLLDLGILNHGTLECRDIAKTRRFYEEVLGMECMQTSPMSLMVRKGTDHCYAVLEMPQNEHEMKMLNHNGFEVGTPEEVDRAFEKVQSVKEEWGLKVMPPRVLHGDYTFYFKDFDGNWWEIVTVRKGGYARNFSDKDWDLTGRHDLDGWSAIWAEEKKLLHTHDPETRERMKAEAQDH